MLRKIVFILFTLLLGFSTAASQAKVGTTGGNFLLLSPSVKLNGMGQAGAAVVSNNSYYFNPANLGLLLSQNNISLSLYPLKSEIYPGVEFLNYSASLPIIRKSSDSSGFYFGIAYYHSKLSSGLFIERTYEQGTIEGTGRTFSWSDKSHNVVLSVARTGKIDFAFGFTAKYLKQTSNDYSTDGLAFDVGGIVRYNAKNCNENNFCSYVIPAFSLALKNYGSDMTIINNPFPLPKVFSFGNSVEIGLEKQYSETKSAQLYNLIAAVDIESHTDDYWMYKFGLDVSLYEIINVRVGRITDNGSSLKELTYGFSLSTFRLGKFMLLTSDGANANTDGRMVLLYNKLNIEYNFANYDRYFTSEAQNYHEIVLNYAL